ncbi:hypothetical protein C8T65DRAFT_579631, partial [Cerioporus squamosus]
DMFVGAVSCLHRDQMSADIYVTYVWTTVGQLIRISHVCVTYGLAIVVVQRGVCPQPGVIPNQFFVHGPSLVLIRVNDEGPQHMNVHGAPAQLPNAHLIQNGHQVFHIINGFPVAGKAVPWHHRVTMEHATPGTPLHYHKHARRQGHTSNPPPILPQHRGTHKQFRRLVFSTQVQNCRRIQQ